MRQAIWEEIYASENVSSLFCIRLTSTKVTEDKTVQKEKEIEEEVKVVVKVVPERIKPLTSQPPRSRVKSLWYLCISYVCENLELYEGFENVPVPWKAKMYAYLSEKNELT